MRRSVEAGVQLAAAQARGEVRPIRSFRHIPWDVYRVEPAAEPAFAARMARAGVQAEPAGHFHLTATPNDPRFINQTEIDTPFPDADIYLKEAWDVTTDTRNVVVAIIDSGIKADHPDLVSNLWINPLEAAGTTGVDDDGNGYVDDINGWDFTDNVATLFDMQGHGTSVAGIIAAEGNNAQGVAGTSWQGSMMVLKAFQGQDADEADILAALDYVLDSGVVRIVNASWGDTVPSSALREAIELMRQRGILLIAAAGNDNFDLDVTPFYPASYYDLPNVVSVAAIAQNGTKAGFSSYGPHVSLAAPGVQVETTSIASGGYAKVNGTSFATPRVAGAAALLMAHFPAITAETVRLRLIQSSRPTASLAPTVLEGRLLDVHALLETIPTAAYNWSRYE